MLHQLLLLLVLFQIILTLSDSRASAIVINQHSSAPGARHHAGHSSGVDRRQAMPRPGQLVDFQVSQPILLPSGSSNQYGCIYRQILMEHVFANSYGAPFVGSYTPPPCDFNRVVMNLTVTSKGRQYDRLALMYLGDTEVFRTSTAEPTTTGIIWTYIKEMQHYNALWKRPQKLIFDLGNLQNDMLTGAFETTLTATFFTVPESPPTADEILPISSRSSSSGQGSSWQIPGANASVKYAFPRDTTRAVVALSACGQSSEEFWYSNVPSSRTDTFPNTTGTLPGGGTFREVQLLVDGRLSGVSWPFPVIFTGGIVPGFWRPIVGIDAFDLAQNEIDITPLLGLLLDGRPHSFEIRVASVADNGKNQATLVDMPTSYWLVSGSIFIFRDPNGIQTKATPPRISVPPINLAMTSRVTTSANGSNQTLTYSTNATRQLQISSTITTGNGSTRNVVWSQALRYSNFNQLTSAGLVQLTKQSTYGADALIGGSQPYSFTYAYPLVVNSSFVQNGDNLILNGALTRGKQLAVFGNSVLPSGLQNFRTGFATGSKTQFSFDDGSLQQVPAQRASSQQRNTFQGVVLNSTQVGSAYYNSGGGGTSGTAGSFGTTEQWFSFHGAGDSGGGYNEELYNRHVKAVNATVVVDQQTLFGHTYGPPARSGSDGAQEEAGIAGPGLGGVRQFLGRGPGTAQGLTAKGQQQEPPQLLLVDR